MIQTHNHTYTPYIAMYKRARADEASAASSSPAVTASGSNHDTLASTVYTHLRAAHNRDIAEHTKDSIVNVCKRSFPDFGYCTLPNHACVVESRPLLGPGSYDLSCGSCTLSKSYNLLDIRRIEPRPQTIEDVNVVRDAWKKAAKELKNEQQLMRLGEERVSDSSASRVAIKAWTPQLAMQERTAWLEYFNVAYNVVRADVINYWSPRVAEEHSAARNSDRLMHKYVLFMRQFQGAAQERTCVESVRSQFGADQSGGGGILKVFCFAHGRADAHLMPFLGAGYYNTQCWRCPLTESAPLANNEPALVSEAEIVKLCGHSLK